jgi:hypothetical protein
VSEDIKEKLQTIKCSPKFALQIDESTDVAELAQLLVFVRYRFEENIWKEFMFCGPLSGRCTWRDIFEAVNDYFAAQDMLKTSCGKMSPEMLKWRLIIYVMTLCPLALPDVCSDSKPRAK